MAGNHRSGRTPKPAEFHVLHGTHRADRHGPATEQAFDPDGGAPIVKPEGLTGEAGKLFDELLPRLRPILKPTDTAAFLMLCNVYALYAASLAIAQTAPTDKPAKSAVLGYLAAFDKLAARFGLTPTDRQRLRASGAVPPEPDEFDLFLARRNKLAKYVSHVAQRQR